jgi:hypothetical protein
MRPTSRTILFSAFIGVLFYSAQLLWWPETVDYFYTFHKATDTWWKGQAVYDTPYYGFFNAPWLILLLTPLQWMTYIGGQAALNTFSFFVILLGWRWFAKSATGYARPLSLAICLFNLHLFDLLLRGQIDGFVLLGTLGMLAGVQRKNPYILSMGWFFAAIRPTSIFLLWPYTLWLAYRGGYLKKALIIPIIVVGLSLIIFDPLWMWRWYEMIRFKGSPLPGYWLVSWWRAADTLHLPNILALIVSGIILAISLWALARYKPQPKTAFAFLILTSLLIMPYTLSYHYSVLMAIFIPLLLGWRLWLAMPLFLLTLTPVLRAFWGVEFSWLDIFFILFAWMAMLFYMKEKYQQNYSSLAFKPKTTLPAISL